jgi:hypothetical protein
MIKITRENFETIRRDILSQDFLDGERAEEMMLKYDPKEECDHGDDGHGHEPHHHTAPTAFERVDDPMKPVLMDDKKTRIFLWNDPMDPLNPRKMVAIYATIRKEGDTHHVEPELVIKGPDAHFALFYKMSCCGGLSTLTAFSQGGVQKHEVRDSKSGTLKGEAQLFAGKVKVATTEKQLNSMHHMYLDIKKIPHQCASHESYQKSDVKKQHKAPAPKR